MYVGRWYLHQPSIPYWKELSSGFDGADILQAEKTIVWIGEDEKNEAGYAFDILKSCGLVGLLNEGLEKIHIVMRSVTSNGSASLEITNIDQAIEAFIVGVSPIFKKDWFNRQWVVQGVLLAERADMVFGLYSI